MINTLNSGMEANNNARELEVSLVVTKMITLIPSMSFIIVSFKILIKMLVLVENPSVFAFGSCSIIQKLIIKLITLMN